MNVSEIGKRLVINANYDLSSYSQLELVITRPDGTTFTRTNPAVSISASPLVTLDAGTLAANKYTLYSMQEGDLTVPGEYLVRLSYTDPTPLHLTETTSFTVNA
jgi:hypothetical protein